MGTKFNIFYDRIFLAETSNFSKFFTGSEPIKIIHDVLKISHDTEAKISPTNNRHVLWDKLRDGDALFVRINHPESIKKSIELLKTQLNKLTPVQGKGRAYNEIKTICSQAINIVKKGNVESLDHKKIKAHLTGPRKSGKKSILDIINEIYPNKDALVDAINNFILSINPGNYILIKRVPSSKSENPAVPWDSPRDRSYPVRQETDKSGKVFGQQYVVWHFNEFKLISKERIQTNATLIFRKYFTGWGDRDFFIIENESFLPSMKHPFVSQKNMRFEKILPLDKSSIVIFANSHIKRFEKILIKEIEEVSTNLKSRVQSDMERTNISPTN